MTDDIGKAYSKWWRDILAKYHLAIADAKRLLDASKTYDETIHWKRTLEFLEEEVRKHKERMSTDIHELALAKTMAEHTPKASDSDCIFDLKSVAELSGLSEAEVYFRVTEGEKSPKGRIIGELCHEIRADGTTHTEWRCSWNTIRNLYEQRTGAGRG